MSPALPPSKDWIDFAQYYKEKLATAGAACGVRCGRADDVSGRAQLNREISICSRVWAPRRGRDAFLTSTAPGSLEVGRRNKFCKSQDDFLQAIADTIAVE